MSDYDKSLEQIIKERNFVKKDRTKLNDKAPANNVEIARQMVGRRSIRRKTVGGIVTKSKLRSQQLVNIQKGMRSNVKDLRRGLSGRQLIDARSMITGKQKKVHVKDAREMLTKKKKSSSKQMTDARQKLNKLNSRNLRQSWKGGAFDEITSTTTPELLTWTVRNTLTPPNVMRTNKKANNERKQVILSGTGLTVIKKQSPVGLRKSIRSPGVSIFARTFESLTNETPRRSNVQPKYERLPETKRSYEESMEDSDDAYDDLIKKNATRTFNKPNVTMAVKESAPPNISRGLQMRLGASDSGPIATPGAIDDSEGYIVRVSNLHPKVTQEDIKELFGDVGPLHQFQLFKQGIADIVYVKLADAKKAIDNYHDRELDGQPMKCKLMNRQLAIESQFSKYLKTGTLHSDRIPSARLEPIVDRPSMSTGRIVPDVSVIHKALFHRNAPQKMAANRNASITVTL